MLPAIGEIVEDGQTGLLVPLEPDDRAPFFHRVPVGALEAAMRRLVEDEALRRAMGALGKARVATGRFSIARRNEALARVCAEAFAGRAGRTER